MCEQSCTESGFQFAPFTPDPTGSRRRGRGRSLIKAYWNHEVALVQFAGDEPGSNIVSVLLSPYCSVDSVRDRH